MTILLHGDNITASRNKFLELKSSFDGEVLELDPKNPVAPQNSLFADNQLFLIWLDQKVSATQLKSYQSLFPNLQTEEFKLPAVVFAFLDALKPGNQKIFIPLWQKYIASEVPEVAFTMVIRQFRLMLDPGDLAPWQAGKIAAQAKLFNGPAVYKKLLQIDYQIKSGHMPFDLRTALELWLLTL